MTQHTHGEWHVNDQTENGWMDNAIYVTTRKGHVCKVYSETGNPKEIARLIAAAPKLLEVLKEWLQDIEGFEGKSDEYDAMVDRARAAIAAAKGEAS